MIKINCHSNLDLQCERWPTELPAVPRVGELIESGTIRSNSNSGFRLTLEVSRVCWASRIREYQPGVRTVEWYCDVELHLGGFTKEMSIKEFHEWYQKAIRN